MAKATTRPTNPKTVAEVDRHALQIWRREDESFSQSWLRAWEELDKQKTGIHQSKD